MARAAAQVIPSRWGPAASVAPPVDVHAPFDVGYHYQALKAALAGADNAWARVRDVTPEHREQLAAAIEEASARFSPGHEQEMLVRAYASIMEVHAERSRDVARFIRGLPDLRERGPILHGYVGDIAVPEGKQQGTFEDLKDFLPILQGRKPPRSALGRAMFEAMERLTSTALGQRLGLADTGLAFRRGMYTPFHEEDGLDGGYSQIDPLTVDARYGGNAAHAQYMAAAVRRGVETIADRIPNHNSRLHARTQALLAGDLSRLAEHVNWSGAVKVGERLVDGQKYNIILHAGDEAGAVSEAWCIFPDSNPDGLVRIQVPVTGPYRDLPTLRRAMGTSFALDGAAQAQVRSLYAEYGFPEPDADGVRRLPREAQEKLETLREENTSRALLRLRDELAQGKTPMLDVDLFMSFMGNIQFDKNMAHPEVIQEELDAHAHAARLGQTGVRWDAVIHAGKRPGTNQLNLPQVQAFADFMGLTTHQMMPGRVIVPEAFIPPEEIVRDYLAPHLEAGGERISSRGNQAISFKAAISNTKAILTGDLRPVLDHMRQMQALPKDGEWLGYAARLHDETLLEPELMEALITSGKLKDPFAAVDGQQLSAGEAMGILENELRRHWALFANRAAGNDASTVLGSPEKIAQAIALSYAGTEIPAVYYRLLVGAGDNVEFALQQMKLRLDMQEKAGEPLNLRKAFDARDLGRGPVSVELWKQRIRERYAPLVTVRALNRLWQSNATVRSRDFTILTSEDPSVALLARRSERARGLLQLFNAADEAKTVRISKAELAEQLGWTDFQGASFKDVLGSTIQGRSQRVAFRVDGDSVELTVPAHGQLFLEKRGSAALEARFLRRFGLRPSNPA